MSHRSKPITNDTIWRLFRCTHKELRHLKQSFKSALLSQTVHGRPLLGQLPSASDPDGSLRADVWEAVGRKDAMLRTLLRGERWAPGPLPEGFEERVKRVREKIFWDLNAAVRRKRPVEGMGAEEKERRSRQNDRYLSRSGKRVRHTVVDDSSEEADDSPEIRRLAAQQSNPTTRLSEPLGLSGGDSSDGDSQSDATGANDGASESPSPQVQMTSRKDAASQSGITEITRSEFVESNNPMTTLPGAVRRIQQLETRVEALEERIRDQDTQAEGRVLRSVRGMLAERDRKIERLRFYLEGDR